MRLCVVLLCYRVRSSSYIKYNLPSIADWDTLFMQTREFILTCNGEQVRYATDSCE